MSDSKSSSLKENVDSDYCTNDLINCPNLKNAVAKYITNQPIEKYLTVDGMEKALNEVIEYAENDKSLNTLIIETIRKRMGGEKLSIKDHLTSELFNTSLNLIKRDKLNDFFRTGANQLIPADNPIIYNDQKQRLLDYQKVYDEYIQKQIDSIKLYGDFHQYHSEDPFTPKQQVEILTNVILPQIKYLLTMPIVIRCDQGYLHEILKVMVIVKARINELTREANLETFIKEIAENLDKNIPNNTNLYDTKIKEIITHANDQDLIQESFLKKIPGENIDEKLDNMVGIFKQNFARDLKNNIASLPEWKNHQNLKMSFIAIGVIAAFLGIACLTPLVTTSAFVLAAAANISVKTGQNVPPKFIALVATTIMAGVSTLSLIYGQKQHTKQSLIKPDDETNKELFKQSLTNFIGDKNIDIDKLIKEFNLTKTRGKSK